MTVPWTKEALIAFEDRVKQAFLGKRVKAPIHMSGGNESELIEVFKDVRPQDWVFATYRGHYAALLKGIEPEWVFNEILSGRSMYLMNKRHKFFSSAIVGGALPAACGVALAAKRLGLDEKVFVFVGDMAARTGVFHEFTQYCGGHGLNVEVVVENNGLSTDTPTRDVWGTTGECRVRRYSYDRVHPHCGVGVTIQF